MNITPLELNAHHGDETTETTPRSVSLRSGTGAPIFEPGAHTRIRRNPVRAFAALTWDGGPREIFGQVLNVSLTGCLIKTESTIQEGTQLEVSVTVVGSENRSSIDVRGTVRRQTFVDGRRAYGVEFISTSSVEKQSVQALYSETA